MPCPWIWQSENRGVFLQHNWVVFTHMMFGGRSPARKACAFLGVAFVLLYLLGFSLTMALDTSALPRALQRRFGSDVAENSAAVDAEPWALNRKYGIVIDAGSSGSRLQIYSWKDTAETAALLSRFGRVGNLTRDSLPIVEKGDEDGEDWQYRVEPGISAFGPKPQDLPNYLKPLMDHALKVIPAAEISSTPLFLYATAGMRLLPAKQRDDVLAATCRFFRTNYKFHLPDCAAHIQVISGEWEGIYGWVAINQLLDGFVTDETLGFLDMGGASTQITFEPTAEIRTQHANDMMPVKLRTLGGKELSYSVYTTTFLGYGMNEARRRYVSWLVERAQKQASGLAKEVGGKQAALAAEDKSVITTATGSPRLARRAEADSAHVEPREEKPAPNEPGPSSAHSPPSSSHSLRKMEGTLEAAPNVTASANRWTVLDPCLPKGATIKDREHQSTAVAKLNPTLEGTGSFAQCVLTTIPLLNKTAPCPDEPCLFNGVHIPGGAPGRRPDMHFIGISEYWYTVENVFMLGGDYSYKDFANAARTFCGQDWNVTMQRFKSGKYPHVHDVEKLEFQCFKAAWLVNFLHEGLGIPKEFLADEDKDDMVPLRSVNEISGLQISWTLGVMVIFAAGTVPPAEAPGTWTKMSLAATLAVPMALLGVCFFAVFLMWGQGRKRIFTHRNSTVEFPLARRHPRSGSEGSSLLHPHGDIETGNGQESFDAEESVFAPKAGKMPDAFNHCSGVDRRGSPKPIGEEWAPKLARTTSFLGRGSPRPPNSPSRKGSVRQ